MVDVLVRAGFAPSKGEARRLVEQGGVQIDGAVVSGIDAVIASNGSPRVVQKGKRFFVKLTPLDVARDLRS